MISFTGGAVLIPNNLVPKHELLNADEANQILEKYDVTKDELPRIKKDDVAIEMFGLEVATGDIVRITRENPVTGKSYYYRIVIDG